MIPTSVVYMLYTDRNFRRIENLHRDSKLKFLNSDIVHEMLHQNVSSFVTNMFTLLRRGGLLSNVKFLKVCAIKC